MQFFIIFDICYSSYFILISSLHQNIGSSHWSTTQWQFHHTSNILILFQLLMKSQNLQVYTLCIILLALLIALVIFITFLYSLFWSYRFFLHTHSHPFLIFFQPTPNVISLITWNKCQLNLSKNSQSFFLIYLSSLIQAHHLDNFDEHEFFIS